MSASHPRKTDVTITYALGKEHGPKTLTATLSEEGGRFVLEEAGDDGGLSCWFQPCNRDGYVELATGDSSSRGSRRGRATFRPARNAIAVNWSHEGKEVSDLELESEVFETIRESLQSARDAVVFPTIAEAEERRDATVPDLPLKVEATRMPSLSPILGETYEKIEPTVKLANYDRLEQWERWGEAFIRAGNDHRTHYKQHYVYPPENRGYGGGDTLDFRELVDEWHCVDPVDVIEQARIGEIDRQDLQFGEIVRLRRAGEWSSFVVSDTQFGELRDEDWTRADLQNLDGGLAIGGIGGIGCQEMVERFERHQTEEVLSERVAEQREQMLDADDEPKLPVPE